MVTPELKSYIQNLKSSGYSDEQIVSQLRTAGWQELDITSVLSGQTSQPVAMPQFLSLKWILFGIALLVLVSLLVGGYFYLRSSKDRSSGDRKRFDF